MNKYKTLMIAVSSCLVTLAVQSTENDQKLYPYMEMLKSKFSVIRNGKFPNDMPLPTPNDFEAIETLLPKEAPHFPSTLQKFYEVLGNRRFTGVDLLRPLGGNESHFYQQLSKRYTSELKRGWLPFAECQGNEWYAIHLKTGEIQLFVRELSIEPSGQAYNLLSDWIHVLWL